MEEKFELGVVFDLDMSALLFWTNWLLLPLTSLSPSFMAVPFFMKLLLERFIMNEYIIMLIKSPAKKGFHHRVDLLGHVLDQQWNSRADTPIKEEKENVQGINLSTISRQLFWSSRMILRVFLYLLLIHLIPCSCGSIISGHLID